MQSTIMDCKLLLFFQKSHKHPQTNKESAIFLTVNLLLHSLILGETFLHWKKEQEIEMMGVNNEGEQQWGVPFLKLNRRRKKSTRFKTWLMV